MDDQFDSDSIHFLLRQTDCVISGRSWSIKELIKQGTKRYIAEKRVWIIPRERATALIAQAEAMGKVCIVRQATNGDEADQSSVTDPTTSGSHETHGDTPVQIDQLALQRMLHEMRTLYQSTRDMTDELYRQYERQKERERRHRP